MRKLIIIASILLCTNSVFAVKIATLNEIMRPYCITVDNGQLYIVDDNIIRLYSLEGPKHITTIGRKGLGPGEFPFSPSIQTFPGLLLVNSWGKIMFFARDGQYKNEKRLDFPISYFVYPLFPLGEEGFLGPRHKLGEMSIAFTIFDKDLNPLKELSSGLPNLPPMVPPGGAPKRDIDLIGDCWNYFVYKDKIFLADTRIGFYFKVFNFKGEGLYEIQLTYKKINVEKEDKERFMERLEASRDWDKNKSYFNVIFRDTYPAFACFQIANDKIYAYTYTRKDDKYEIIVLDLNGNILKRVYVGPDLPNTNTFKNRFSISNNKIYYLKEDVEKENWDLYADEIE